MPPAPSHERSRPPSPWTTAAALGIVYVVWGSTYAAIRIGLGGFPPFLLGAFRFVTAGTLLLLLTRIAGRGFPSRREVRDAAITGVLLLFVGNGGVVWSEQYVASGLAAVIVATVPLWMVLLDALFPGGERVSAAAMASSAVGLLGVGILMAGGIVLGRGTEFWLGVGALLLGSFGWALGSIYGRHAARPASPAAATAVQMIAGGAALALLATTRGEWSQLEWARVRGAPLLANAYLVVFGSLVAFSAYVWLLRAAPPVLVGTYAYVNPVVAVILGFLLFGERLDAWAMAGTAVILLSVVLVQAFRRRATPAPAPAHAPPPARSAEQAQPLGCRAPG